MAVAILPRARRDRNRQQSLNSELMIRFKAVRFGSS